MMSRRRCEPASGASVKPVLRTRRICSSSAGARASTRVDGSDTATRRAANLFISSVSTGLTQE
jgi:hypothetical protein